MQNFSSMNKRYQVFVSSTFADLRNERSKVITTLMEMDCIPSGMELFPATDEEQWEFIKKVIDDCDYYLLIIGGRYGSTTSEGISYTEKEYDYAVEQGMKVIALLHKNPDDIPIGKSEKDPTLRGKLSSFRDKVSQNRLVKFWNSAEELPGLVALSVTKTIKTYPAEGWVRANSVTDSPKLLTEINELRKKNEDLEDIIKKYSYKSTYEIENLAEIDDLFEVKGDYYRNNQTFKWNKNLSWKEIFSLIAPYLMENPNDKVVKTKLSKSIFDTTDKNGYSPEINDQIYQSIKIQFKAMNLIDIKYLKTVSGGMSLFWILTKNGERKMMELRSISKNV